MNNLLSDVIGYRRDLHQIPELGFAVNKTRAYIWDILTDYHCQLDTIVDTGILAYFDFGAPRTLCFRTDMDGLPIPEDSGLPFASTNGCMHACGHDGHMANMLGFAKWLNQEVEDQRSHDFNALLLFQPAEETIDGARCICETDVFARYHVSAIYGLHLWPGCDTGVVATCPGPMMAKSTTLEIEFQGLSSHCGEPEKGHDALLAACQFVTQVKARRASEITENCILHFGTMESGTVLNAISNHTMLRGSMRSFQESTWQSLVKILEETAASVEAKYGVTVRVDYSKYHPAVINDEALYQNFHDSLEGAKTTKDTGFQFQPIDNPSMIAEDFSFFQEHIPGLFFWLGTGAGIPLHANNFTIAEETLLSGVHLFQHIFNNA